LATLDRARAEPNVTAAAGLLLTLKGECERQHARAETAEALVQRLQKELEAATSKLPIINMLKLKEEEIKSLQELVDTFRKQNKIHNQSDLLDGLVHKTIHFHIQKIVHGVLSWIF